MSDANPYLIEGPALISFSGGRTSGYMLKQILDAHGGKLPDDVHVCFANTGKEREETLRFVHECATRWGVRIRWLEWRDRRKRTPVDHRFEEVGLNSASRAGEPFKALVKSKKSVPNAVARWCTEHLKMQALADFMEAQGYKTWANVVGLRADEMRRAVKKDKQNDEGVNAWVSVMPMVKARVTKRTVRWSPRPSLARRRNFRPQNPLWQPSHGGNPFAGGNLSSLTLVSLYANRRVETGTLRRRWVAELPPANDIFTNSTSSQNANRTTFDRIRANKETANAGEGHGRLPILWARRRAGERQVFPRQAG